MTATIPAPLTPISGALNPNPPGRRAAASPAPSAVEQRHRAHCRICSGDDAKTAEEFVDALFDAHAPWLNPRRLPNLLTRRARS